jgi:DNA-binding SARP family transcriptional activator
MLRLVTFGGLRVLRDEVCVAELANQRKRLAILAVVAAAAPLGVSRERLLFLLWPDAEGDRGRNALNQLVYNLRRELGESPIDGTTELSLLPDVMSADLTEFRAAVSRGEHATVAALYAGSFLDGFFVPGADEFERWADEERSRTMRQVVASLDTLAAAARAAGDANDEAHWTERLVELDPLSARRALEHMRALEQNGDRDAAIRYGRRYDALARADDDEVDPAVAQEVERLRTLPTVLAAGSSEEAVQRSEPTIERTLHNIASTAVAHSSIADAAPDATAHDDGAKSAAPIAPRTHTATPAAARRTARWTSLAAIVGVVSILSAGIVAWRHAGPPALPLERGARMLLADVQMPGADSINARGVALALQSALQQSPRVRLLSPAAVGDALRRMGRNTTELSLPDSTAVEVAEREGARYVLSLAVSPPVNGTRLLSLRVLDPTTQSALQSYSASATGDGLLAALDDLAGKLRRALGDPASEIAAAMTLPRATTPSLEALRLLAGGRAAFNRGQYQDSRTLYSSALALDSGFAAAHAGLASIEYVMNNIPAADAHMAHAMALADRLPPREHLMIEAVAARGRGDWNKAATLHRAYLIRYPDDYDVYSLLGYDLMRARAPDEALAAYDSSRAHRRQTANDLINIGAINVQLGRYTAAREAQVAALRLDSTVLVRSMQNEEFGATLLRLGFADSARAIHAVMLSRGRSDQARGHRSLAYVDLFEGKYTSALHHLQNAVEMQAAITSQGGSGLSEVRDRALLAMTYLDLGQRALAREQLREAARRCLTSTLSPPLLLWTGKPLARLGDTAIVRQLLDSARRRARETDRAEVAAVAVLEAELQLARGALPDGIAAARRAAASDSSAYAVETLAYALERARMWDESRAQYLWLHDARQLAIGKEGQQMTRLAPLALARIDALRGHADSAQRDLAAFIERWPTADADLPMISSLRARIDARRAAP